jgi:hypothetical protein
MRKVDGDVNAGSRHHSVGRGTALIFWPKDGSIIVDSPEALDFFIRKYISIITVEYVDRFRSADLKQKIALSIHVIGCYPLR